MIIPDEYKHRVFRTRFEHQKSTIGLRYLLIESYPNAEVETIYEPVRRDDKSITTVKETIVIVFEEDIDCMAFTLKHGKDYG